MWVHEQGLGGELSMPRSWNEPIHAREANFKKCTFLMLERERELSKLGGALVSMK